MSHDMTTLSAKNARNGGGPAFPIVDQTGSSCLYETYGMSLRDYFASKAMQAMIARGEDDGRYAAESAYRYADAMIEARKTGPEEKS